MAIAGMILCLSCMVSGMMLLRARTSQLSAVLLLMSGVVGFGAVWAGMTPGVEGPTVTLWIVSSMFLVPIAFWAYPMPRWRTSTDVLLGVLLVGPGLVALTDPRDVSHVATMAFVAVTALLVQTWWRLEHSAGRERRGLTWFGLAAGVGGFVALLLLFLGEGSSASVTHVGIALLAFTPAAMAFGALRPDLVDVRGLVVHVVVLAVLGTAFIAYYVSAISVLNEIFEKPPGPAFQGVVALLGAAGLRQGSIMLRGSIDRLLFGVRPDALHAATHAIEQFGADPDTALDAVCESLVLPYAHLVVGSQIVGTSGMAGPSLHSIPLAFPGHSAGELVVGLRPGDLRLAPRDENVLRLVGLLVLHSVRERELVEDLRESRGRAVATIEEERRRLRRDLHDGLGPTLTGIAFSAEAARNSMRADPDLAEALLVTLRSDAAEAVDAIRLLVYGMRPPALDELGLERALRQQNKSLHTRCGAPLVVEFEVTGEIPPLTAAVEVAAYRIVMEALSNVARHSTGTNARVWLSPETDRLILQVTDDGASAEDWLPGIGSASMHERAAAVGGDLTCRATSAGGVVDVVLPSPYRLAVGTPADG